MNGAPLTTEHGGPLRLVVPDWYGMASVKWLTRLEAREDAFQGYYQAQRYVYDPADGSPVTPVSTMRVKALITAPADGAHVGLETVTVRGRAWSGEAPIAKVEVSTRGGEFWEEARLLGAPSAHAWTAWEFTWRPSAPGRHALRVRATDAAGNRQPDVGRWNRHGYGSNGVRLHVLEVDG
jgi:DMSO/TMAO reductase YedYZ molybdopterin-dependent catalytic subunit